MSGQVRLLSGARALGAQTLRASISRPQDTQRSLHQFEQVAARHILPIFEKHQYKQQHGQNKKESGHQQGSSLRFKSIGGIGVTALALSGIITSNSNQPPDNIRMDLFDDLHQAVLDGDETRVKSLLKKCNPNEINARHELGWQPLHVAAINGKSRICELLLNAGARINDPDHYSSHTLMARKLNMDPLLVALTRDDQFYPELARGINYSGCTALHYAALSNNMDTVQTLTKYGANPMSKTDQGFTPAKFTSSQNIARFLSQYEKDYVKREKELDEEERRKYPLEKRVKEHIVGQDAAISTVAATIRRKETGWFDREHPLVFLFLGSSGVGKTELAKRIAKYLHKDKKEAFVRLDMSEYQEKHSVARMIGSPPGYVGHQDGGRLTEALKKCENAVVLFDEVEKAHPDVLTVLLQLFDEGRLTDGKGNTIECKDAIFIMTSNLASDAIAERAIQLREEQQLAKELRHRDKIMGLVNPDSKDEDYQEQITISRKFKDTIVKPRLKSYFKRDEFLGRINEMVYFLPFSDRELKQLVNKELEYWATRAKENNSIVMTWDESVIETICKEYDVHYGARSIKHAIERRIINEVSELHYKNRKAKKVHISAKQQDDAETDLIHIKIS